MRAINWLNYKFIKEDGYGRYGIHMVRALTRAGVCVHPSLVEMTKLPGDLARMAGLDYSKLTISLMPPHELPAIPGRQINYTMYEANRLRKGWVDKVNDHCERVIVPAPWLVDVFDSHHVRVPVHVIHGGIEPSEFPMFRRRLGERPYTFMTLGDRGSRKGWDVTWGAFYKAFGDSKDVRLVVKTRSGGLTFEERVRFDMTNSDRRLSAWREDVESMADAYASADCFVFPTRAEGWGLPPREAAATGLPVITTNWSGTAVGIEHWAIPIERYKMVNASIEAEPFEDGSLAQWAMADEDEVAEHMRWCYEHQDEAQELGMRAAQWLRDNQTWDHSARQLIDLLDGRDNGTH